MKKFFATLLTPLLLLGCGDVSNTGADGYQFGEKQYSNGTVTVNIRTFENREEFERTAKDMGIAQFTKSDVGNIVAFSTIPAEAPYDTCTIYMIDPSTRYEPEWIGHEMAHCIYGQWHQNNNTR